MRTVVIRSEIERLIHQAPFQPFVLNIENGDRVTIEHAENIAFDPGAGNRDGSQDFYVLTRGIRLHAAFDAVTSVALQDTHGRPR